MAFTLFSCGASPSFSISVLLTSLTHAPGVIGVVPPPSAVRKNDRVPEDDCGRYALIAPDLPPTLDQLRVLHV